MINLCKIPKKKSKKKRKGDDGMNATVEKSYTPFQSLKQSLKEMNLIRNKQLPKKTWKQVKEELEKD